MVLEADAKRVAWPLNVTRAFWETQERPAVLKRERRTASERGMLKLVCEEVIRRGMASPRVAFVTLLAREVSCRVMVEQAPASETVQVEPVKPLMQIQLQEPVEREATPPFWQDVAVSFWHCWRGVRFEAAESFFLITRK